jgi:hypothetical protein
MEAVIMPFKFSVGQSVEYTPIGDKKAGVYKVIRQMPAEEQAADLKYRFKSDAEAYERNVLECHLSPDASDESERDMAKAGEKQREPQRSRAQ